MGKQKSKKSITPDSIPSLADSSRTSSYDEEGEVNRVLFGQESNTPIVDNKGINTTYVHDRTPKLHEFFTPESTTTATTAYGSEMLSIGSDEDVSGSNSQIQSSFRTSNCVNVVPVFTTDLTSDKTIEPSGKVKGNDVSTSAIGTQKEDCYSEIQGTDDHDKIPSSSFCSEGLIIPSRDIFRMFDLSPQVWPGWSLLSPSPQEKGVDGKPPLANRETQGKSYFHDVLDGYSDNNSIQSGLSLTIVDSPLVEPHRVIYGWNPPEHDTSIDPVIEVISTPPRSSRSNRHQHIHVVKNEEFVSSDGLVWQGAHFLSSTDSAAETTVTSNIDVAGNKSWERTVEDLERTCVTLKEIIRTDSKVMLQLKAQIEHLQTRNDRSIKNPPSIELLAELHRVKAERDKLLEREVNYVEAISKFQEELSYSIPAADRKEMHTLRKENKLLEKQISETEKERQIWRAQLMTVVQENTLLKAKLINRTTEVVGNRHDCRVNTSQGLEKNALESQELSLLSDLRSHSSEQEAGASVASVASEALRQQVSLLSEKIANIEMIHTTKQHTQPESDVDRSLLATEKLAKGVELFSFVFGKTSHLECNNDDASGMDQLILSIDCKDNDKTVRIKNQDKTIPLTTDNNEVEVTLEGMIITTTEATYCCDSVYEKDRCYYYDSAPKRRLQQRRSTNWSNSSNGESNKENKDPTRTTLPASFKALTLHRKQKVKSRVRWGSIFACCVYRHRQENDTNNVAICEPRTDYRKE